MRTPAEEGIAAAKREAAGLPTGDETMTKYIISTNTSPFYVRAMSYNDAAVRAARKLYGHARTISALRVTGDNSLSGWFQAYLPCSTGGLTSYGENFHVLQVSKRAK